VTSSSVLPQTKPRSLAILQEQVPLRRGGALLQPMQWQNGDTMQAPRALRGLARIVDGGLCHRCGSCIGICPTQVLGVDAEEYPTVKNLSACTDCDLCVKVCPGDEFNFHEEHRKLYGTPGELTDTHGTFSNAIVAYSNDPVIREHSTSGGLVTALLSHLLESKQIDGAIVIGSSAETLWKGKAMVARTTADLLAAMKSKYAICPTNSALAEIRQNPGRYAVVGLPCQIHGYRKAAALDSRIAERVVLAIGLFCHAAIEHEAFRVIWEGLGEKAHGARRFISRIGKHPGTPYLELADGSMYPVYFGERSGYRPTSIEVINVLYRLYTPERCTTCFDGLSDFADISVGDPWMAPPQNSVNFYEGWSFGLIRTARGKAIFDDLVASGKLTSVEVTRREALASNKLMASEKRWRAFRVIETHRRQGKPIPSYGEEIAEFPRHRGWQFLATEIHMLTHIFCFLPRWRAGALRFFLGSGYWLFWANSQRRALRVWVRDNLYRLRTRLFGRE
jgi:coenzyme F420 hydrogenase subunit beta